MTRLLLLSILLTGCAVRARTLGTSVYPWHCWDTRFIALRDSGKFQHSYCEQRGEMFIDGKRNLLRWQDGRVQWEPVK